MEESIAGIVCVYPASFTRLSVYAIAGSGECYCRILLMENKNLK